MCEYLSFFICRSGVINVGNFYSHTGIVTKSSPENYREAEWTSNDPTSLRVRITYGDEEDGEGENWWKALILGHYKTREALLKDFPVGKVTNDPFDGILYTKLIQKRVSTGRGERFRGFFLLHAADKEFKDIVNIKFLRSNGSRFYSHYIGSSCELSFNSTRGMFYYWVDWSFVPDSIKAILKSLNISYNAKAGRLSLKK